MADHAGEHEKHESEPLVEKITEKLHDADSSSSESEGDRDIKSSASAVKSKIYRLFGREKPVHKVLGGGKRTALCFVAFLDRFRYSRTLEMMFLLYLKFASYLNVQSREIDYWFSSRQSELFEACNFDVDIRCISCFVLLIFLVYICVYPVLFSIVIYGCSKEKKESRTASVILSFEFEMKKKCVSSLVLVVL